MIYLIVLAISFFIIGRTNATQIDWDKIINGEDIRKQLIEENKKTNTNTGNIQKTANNNNKGKLNLITTFNKGFIEKYIKDRKKIEKMQKEIEYLKKLSEKEKEKEFAKYGKLLKLYSKIENIIDNADYILLLKYNINGLNYFDYKGEKYLFYIKPFVLSNLSKNKKASNIDKQIQGSLEELLKINNLEELKKKIKEIETKFLLKDFYTIIPLSKISNLFTYKIGGLSQNKYQINLENMKYFNSLYYIPNRLKDYIKTDYIYFYFPISKQFIEDIENRNIEEIDFNKFYCTRLKYLDGYYTFDKTICNFKENSNSDNIISIDLDNIETIKRIHLEIVDRGKEILDISIIAFGILFAFFVYYFLRYLKKERHQHEQDTL